LPELARTRRGAALWSLGPLLTLLAASAAQAQHLQPLGPVDYNPDFQLFAPADLGSFGEPPPPKEGYFLTYDRMYWTIEGLNEGTGLDLPLFRSIEHFPGGPIEPPIVPNSIMDDVPDAEHTWGNRYDLGYIVGHHGWLLSITEGFKQGQEARHGFDLVNPPIATDATITPLNYFIIPLGSVVVNFTHPPGMMDGFIDARVAETMGAGGVIVEGDEFPYRAGDTFADDVDGDGIHGPDGLDSDGDGVPDTVLGIPTDFDDLVTFLPTFDRLTSRNIVRMDSVELMKMYRCEPFHHGSVFEFYYGARYFQFRDSFDVFGTGGTLGRSNWDTRATNNLVGPQLGGRFFNKRGRWTLQAECRFLAGYNIRDIKQEGKIGGWDVVPTETPGTVLNRNGLVPSANNRPLYLNPTDFRWKHTEDQFSPVGELRVEAAYQLTKAVALKVGWTGLFVGNLARASTSVRYHLPNMGILANDHQDVFSNGVNFGVEINR
jgi:hypothetical protein